MSLIAAKSSTVQFSLQPTKLTDFGVCLWSLQHAIRGSLCMCHSSVILSSTFTCFWHTLITCRLFVIPRFLSLSSTFSLYPRSTSMLPNDGVLLFLRPSGQDTRFTFPTHDFDHRYSKAAVIKTFSHASLGRSGPPTHRWCCRLSTTQRFRYSLHVSNSRLRRLIQQRCCYQDIFTHILLGLSGSNTHRRVRFISRTSSEALQLQCSRIAVPNIQMIRTFLEAYQRLFGLTNSDGVIPILGD